MYKTIISYIEFIKDVVSTSTIVITWKIYIEYQKSIRNQLRHTLSPMLIKYAVPYILSWNSLKLQNICVFIFLAYDIF